MKQAKAKQLLSDEHFTVDGTLIESWASFKSFKRKDGKPPKSGSDGTGMVDFKGEKRSNATHESSTDPEAKLMRKGNGQPAKLSFGAHALMENRSGLLVDVQITDSTLFEPKAAAPMLDRRRQARRRSGRSVPTRATTTKASWPGSGVATSLRTWPAKRLRSARLNLELSQNGGRLIGALARLADCSLFRNALR